MHFLDNVIQFIVDLINHMGYYGIALGMLIESACIPLPSELVLPIGGKLVADGTITMLGANIAVAIGSMAGSLLAYAVGHYGGRPFILKYGKYFFIKEKHFYKAEATFNKYGGAAVFFGRLLPIIRTFISLPAGISKMSLKKFIVFSLTGMLPWNFILIFLGYKLGPKFEEVVGPYYEVFKYAVAAGIVLVILFFVMKYFLSKKKAEA